VASESGISNILDERMGVELKNLPFHVLPRFTDDRNKGLSNNHLHASQDLRGVLLSLLASRLFESFLGFMEMGAAWGGLLLFR
jgi:hypothetical protein